MQLTLDGKTCADEVDSIAAAINIAADRAAEAGRRIIEVYVDGQLVESASLADVTSHNGSVNEVRCVSANPREVVRETFLEMRDTLAQTDLAQQQAAQHLQADEVPDAMAVISAALAQWQEVHEVILKGSEFAELSLDEVRSDEMTMIEGTALLTTQLETLATALQQNDLVTLADTLLYEMPATIKSWQQLLRAAADKLASNN